MKRIYVFLFFAIFSLMLLVGCGNNSTPVHVSETGQQETSVPATIAMATPNFDSKPGTLGIHVVANNWIEAEAEVLDGVSMTIPAGYTRQTVSNLQHDFIKDGMQVGGMLLVDIPNEILEASAKSYEGAEELAGYLANQVMPDADPNKIIFSGGGKSRLYDCYIFLTYYDFSTNYAYTHYIYVGESYCYDVWFDDVWHPDGGNLILSTISSEDIKSELNDIDFDWKFVDGELVTQ